MLIAVFATPTSGHWRVQLVGDVMGSMVSADLTGVCIIEKNDFIREGLKSVLGKSRYCVRAGLQNADELVRLKGEKAEKVKDCKVCLIGINAGENLEKAERDIVTIRKCLPEVHVIILSTELDEDLIVFFSRNADGYILRDISEKALIRSIDLVLLGERVFPAGVVDMLCKKAPQSRRNSRNKLSEREVEVLGCLAQGDSNKAIANKLSITDATVKVHLKAILRKLSVSNRTQAALWAATNMNDNNLPGRAADSSFYS